MSTSNVLSIAPGTLTYRRPIEQEILAAVEARFRRSSYLELRRIVGSFHDGVLTLTGRVSTYYLRQVAQALLVGLDGIEAIDNRLEVASTRFAQGRFFGT
jgi:osmotically-inducible protein OsmY